MIAFIFSTAIINEVLYLPSYVYPKKNTVSPAITIYNNV